MSDNSQFQSVDDYMKEQPEKCRKALQDIRSYILEVVPDAQELINYNIPAFALVKGGKREQQVMIAGYKHHVGLYPHPTTMVHFLDELKEYKTGKGSVQFPINEALPKDLIMKMVKYRKDILDESRAYEY
ncbi:DUF1801 domain-containing protein [Clostridia bacterium]|nr:DUF1801 domain-containing protein [Clostridia bacterium]